MASDAGIQYPESPAFGRRQRGNGAGFLTCESEYGALAEAGEPSTAGFTALRFQLGGAAGSLKGEAWCPGKDSNLHGR
jgi:hypothetical protein